MSLETNTILVRRWFFSNYAISGLPSYVISKTPWDYIPDYRSYFSDPNEIIYGLFLYNLSTVLFVPMCFFFSFIHAIWSLTIGQHSLHLIDTSDWEWRKLYCTKRYLVHVPPLFKGRVTLPNRMNFRKISKGGGSFSIQKFQKFIL